MAITANDLRKGMIILYNGDLCQVVDVEFVRPGNWRAMAQTKLKNLKNGSIFQQRYQTTFTLWILKLLNSSKWIMKYLEINSSF
jgi:elongation factor P